MSLQVVGDFTGIVVGAGKASRFGAAVPKQFLELAGRSVIERSVACLWGRPRIRGVVVVLAPERLDDLTPSIRGWPGVVDVVAGGATRAESVARGVAAVRESPFVLVHDAARPLVGAGVVDAVVEATALHGAALPVVEVADTVKRCEKPGWVTETVDRTTLRLAQTPQGFRRDWLEQALRRATAAGRTPTDEAAAVEQDGRRVATVPGEPGNLKITTPLDLEAARSRLEDAGMGLRVGTGFDVHRRGGGQALMLGGVRFDGEVGLLGHSDADVVLHAVMDALLGAAGLGDIGRHFPPDDPAYAGADSRDLAGRVAELLNEAGYEVVNVDLTLLAESPKIRDRVEQMREAIARSLGIQASRVGVKATTLEKLGALGREEGMGCQAVALIRGVGGRRG